MKVSKENCKGCPVFDISEYKENMIKNNICPKRDCVGCPKQDYSKSDE